MTARSVSKRLIGVMVTLLPLVTGACKDGGDGGGGPAPAGLELRGKPDTATLRGRLTAAAATQPAAAAVIDAGPPPRGPERGPVAIPPFTGSVPARTAADPCGGANERCCPGRSCTGGMACVHVLGQPVCMACGIPGGFCCSDGSCGGGACCVRSPASGIARCVAAGTGPCGTDSDVCTPSGRCSSACGAPSQPCCANGSVKWCYAPATACLAAGGQAESCVPCGRAGQPCCAAVDGCESPLACKADSAGTKRCEQP
jgi:hypothetical protein